MTSDLVARVHQHREGLIEGFTKKYFVRRLVYYEEHATFEEAARREMLLKRWRREWKMELIGKENPSWLDLFDSL